MTGRDDTRPRPAGGRALTWGLLVATALAVGLDLLRSGRVVLGKGVPFLDQDGAPVALYVRLGYLVQAVPPFELVLPLAALAGVRWLREHRDVPAVRAAATGLAAVVAARAALTAAAVADLALSQPPDTPGVQSLFSGNRLDDLGPPLTGGLLVVALALVVVRALRTPEPAPGEGPDEDVHTGPGDGVDEPAGELSREAAPDPPSDPHARFRRAGG